MIFNGLGQGSPAPEGVYRRPDLKAGELEALNNGNEAKKSKSFRRKRTDLMRLRSISWEKSADPLISSDLDVSLKKKRFEIEAKTETVVIGNALVVEFEQNDDVAGSGVAERLLLPHGTLSTIGRRREMEDAVAVEVGFVKRGRKSFDFFGVYDGHGGWCVAHACSEMLHKLLARIVEEERGEEVIAWEKVMAAAFTEMDCEVNKSGAAVATTGSTAVVAVVGEEHVVVANCGDSRAVLSRGGVAVQLSDDHKVKTIPRKLSKKVK